MPTPAQSTKVERRTVDLSQYPDLVVVYLGMRVNRLTGLKIRRGQPRGGSTPPPGTI
ncbi:MAG: hypothetical protein WB622_16830 [Acidobacteriaceae bacterium]